MKIETQGMDGLRAGLRAARDAGREGLGDVVRSGTRIVANEVVRASGSRGRVRAGVSMKVTGSGLATQGRVALAGAAIPASTGARPHVIEPKRGTALRFGGRFAARVQHPGMRGDRFFKRGVDKALPLVEAELAALGEQIMDTIADEIDRS